jgi:hypothetical protein
MKKIMNSGSSKLIKLIAVFTVISVLLVSCLKNNTNDNSALYEEQFQNMKKDNNMASRDSVAYNVFMTFLTDTTDADTSRATPDNAVLISYTGYDYSGALITTTDEAISRANNTYRGDVIYGPVKAIVKYSIGGIYVGLLHMPKFSKATLVIPSDMAYGTGPVKFIISLHQIIKDLPKYEEQQRKTYADTIGFDNGSIKYAIDSTLQYKINTTGDIFVKPIYYSLIKIKLYANYCEFEPGVLDSIPGRQFFPINKSGDTLSYRFENTTLKDFPITPAIDSMVATMKINEVREFITNSANAYGPDGYVHPYIGTYIVPPYMSIHYKVTLLKVDE